MLQAPRDSGTRGVRVLHRSRVTFHGDSGPNPLADAPRPALRFCDGLRRRGESGQSGSALRAETRGAGAARARSRAARRPPAGSTGGQRPRPRRAAGAPPGGAAVPTAGDAAGPARPPPRPAAQVPGGSPRSPGAHRRPAPPGTGAPPPAPAPRPADLALPRGARRRCAQPRAPVGSLSRVGRRKPVFLSVFPSALRVVKSWPRCCSAASIRTSVQFSCVTSFSRVRVNERALKYSLMPRVITLKVKMKRSLATGLSSYLNLQEQLSKQRLTKPRIFRPPL